MSAFGKNSRTFMTKNPKKTVKNVAFVVYAAIFMISTASCNSISADKQAGASDTKIGCRLNNPAPKGYLAVNYVADHDQCPSPSGDQTVYTAMIIEKYEDKPVGARMEICNGQQVPKGWVAVGPSQGKTACPREPGDPTVGPTRFIIQRTN
jgi:hypothetical protein